MKVQRKKRKNVLSFTSYVNEILKFVNAKTTILLFAFLVFLEPLVKYTHLTAGGLQTKLPDR